jgi:hypothetical protein
VKKKIYNNNQTRIFKVRKLVKPHKRNIINQKYKIKFKISQKIINTKAKIVNNIPLLVKGSLNKTILLVKIMQKKKNNKV